MDREWIPHTRTSSRLARARQSLPSHPPRRGAHDKHWGNWERHIDAPMCADLCKSNSPVPVPVPVAPLLVPVASGSTLAAAAPPAAATLARPTALLPAKHQQRRLLLVLFMCLCLFLHSQDPGSRKEGLHVRSYAGVRSHNLLGSMRNTIRARYVSNKHNF